VPPAEENQAAQPLREQAYADTAFVFDFIARRGSTGISAAAIKEAAQKRGLAIGKNFPYKILWRLNKSGEIRRDDNGLYFPAPQG
jgi:hypothetical protein